MIVETLLKFAEQFDEFDFFCLSRKTQETVTSLRRFEKIETTYHLEIDGMNYHILPDRYSIVADAFIEEAKSLFDIMMGNVRYDRFEINKYQSFGTDAIVIIGKFNDLGISRNYPVDKLKDRNDYDIMLDMATMHFDLYRAIFDKKLNEGKMD